MIVEHMQPDQSVQMQLTRESSQQLCAGCRVLSQSQLDIIHLMSKCLSEQPDQRRSAAAAMQIIAASLSTKAAAAPKK